MSWTDIAHRYGPLVGSFSYAGDSFLARGGELSGSNGPPCLGMAMLSGENSRAVQGGKKSRSRQREGEQLGTQNAGRFARHEAHRAQSVRVMMGRAFT